MSLHAFIDESIRGSDYTICAAVIDSRNLRSARQTLRSLLSTGQRRIHFNSESDKRRSQILKAIATLDLWCIVCTVQDPDQLTARATALSEVVTHLCQRGVVQVVLESRQGQDHRDRLVIGQTVGVNPVHGFGYCHEIPTQEPLLWVPDAVAWAWGRDRAWRHYIRRLRLVVHSWKM